MRELSGLATDAECLRRHAAHNPFLNLQVNNPRKTRMLFQKCASRVSDLKLDETLVRELSGLATDRRGLAAMPRTTPF